MTCPEPSSKLAKRLLQEELDFYRDGWSTILIKPGEKRALLRWASSQTRRRNEQEIISDRKKYPLANIGLVCGAISGRTVIDLDGEEGKATFQQQLSHLPATRTHQTPSGGHHLLYSYSDEFHTGANFLHKVDFRNDGGYIIGPGSIVDGIEYRVIDDRPPATIDETPDCFITPVEPPAAHRPPYNGPLPDDMPTMLQMIQQTNPQAVRINPDPRWRFQMVCPIPFAVSNHHDGEGDGGSFFIDADQIVYKCFGCDTGPRSAGRGNPLSLYRHLYGVPFHSPNGNGPAPEPWIPTDEDDPFEQVEDYGELVMAQAAQEEFSQRQIGTWFISSNRVKFRGWKDTNHEYLAWKKECFVAALPERTEAQRDRKRHIRLCWDNYKKLRCVNTGETYLQRYRCGEPTCPICSIWLVEKFLSGEDDEGRSKMDVLKESAEDPSIYLVYLGSLRFSSEEEEAVRQLARAENYMVNLDRHLRDNLKREWNLAGNHIRGIRTKLEGDVAHYQLVIAGNREAGAVEMLREHFSRDTGLDVRVKEIVCHGPNNFKDVFCQLMALRCDWDTAENYQLWRAATKGSRLVQGCGDFYKISGSTPKQSALKMGDCKWCGACTPVELGGIYPVATTRTVTVTTFMGKKVKVAEEDYEPARMVAD